MEIEIDYAPQKRQEFTYPVLMSGEGGRLLKLFVNDRDGVVLKHEGETSVRLHVTELTNHTFIPATDHLFWSVFQGSVTLKNCVQTLSRPRCTWQRGWLACALNPTKEPT